MPLLLRGEPLAWESLGKLVGWQQCTPWPCSCVRLLWLTLLLQWKVSAFHFLTATVLPWSITEGTRRKRTGCNTETRISQAFCFTFCKFSLLFQSVPGHQKCCLPQSMWSKMSITWVRKSNTPAGRGLCPTTARESTSASPLAGGLSTRSYAYVSKGSSLRCLYYKWHTLVDNICLSIAICFYHLIA